MASLREWIRRLWGTIHPGRDDGDLAQELQLHLDLAAEDARRRPTSDDAVRTARIAAGGVSQAMDAVRDQRGLPWLDDFRRDVSHAARTLARSPGVSAVAILTLALGIGVTTAIFSVVYGVLLRPLPYADPDRIMALFEVTSQGRLSALADPNFDDFRDQSRSFQAIAKYAITTATVSGASPPTRAVVGRVSPGFFKVFGVRPIAGREFAADDAMKDASPTVLVSYGYWRQYLGSAADLSRFHLKIDGTSFSVIGALPAGFSFPPKVDFWTPADLSGENPSRTAHNYRAVARLRDGVTLEQADQDISAIARRIHETSSEQGDYLLRDGRAIPLRDSITGTARPALLVLIGAVGFLLIVACANVANLLLAQASVRGRELAVRSALGAGRGRLVRQFLTEAFLLVLIGGGFGVIGAFWSVAGLVALAPANLPRVESIAINVPVLAFACLLSTAVAAGLGAFTAVRATGGDVRGSLAEGARGHAGSPGSQRIGRVIVAAQMAITLVLVVGAGLLGRSLMNVLEVNPGFRIDRIVAMDVSLPWAEDPVGKSRQALFFATLIERIARIPGVHTVGATSGLPLDGGHPDGTFALLAPNEAPETTADLAALFRQKDRLGVADFCVATDGYFRALGIPLIRGRVFDARDGADAPHVAVITRALARERWPDQDPLGRTIEFGNMDGDLRPLTIVGIVGDTREYGLDRPPRPTVYVNLFQRPWAAMSLTILGDADPGQLTTAARGILRELDPEIPAEFRTLPQVYAASLGSRRFNVVLIGFFGIAALVLATTGVFGVMAYSVSRRRREIGVRVALGASTGEVLGMVLAQGMRPIVIGVAIGIAAALALTRTVRALLFGVSSADPVTFGSVTLLLVGAGLLACCVPAWRATKIDPLVALRDE